MEFVQELFMTAFMAIIFSFIIAKLVSIMMAGDDVEHDSSITSNETTATPEETVEENVTLGRALKARGSRRRSEKRVRFVENLDEFQSKIPAKFVEKICDAEVCNTTIYAGTPAKIECKEEDVSGVVSQVIGLSEMPPEERLVCDDVAVEMVGVRETGFEEENMKSGLDNLVVEEKRGYTADHMNASVKEKIVLAPSVDNMIVEEKECIKDQADDDQLDTSFEEKVPVGTGLDNIVVEEKECDTNQAAVNKFCASVEEEILTAKGLNSWVIEEKECTTDQAAADQVETPVEEEIPVATDSDNMLVEETNGAAADQLNAPVKEEIPSATDSDTMLVEETNGAAADKLKAPVQEVPLATRSDTLVAEEQEYIVEHSNGDQYPSVKEQNLGSTHSDDLAVEEKVIENAKRRDEMMEPIIRDDVADQSCKAKVVEVEVRGELSSNEDDDWEGIERSELEEAFAAAANYVGGNEDWLVNEGNDVQMQLYGLHKVATEGPCHEPQPMALKVSARAKWNAWQTLGNRSPEEAMEQYIAVLSERVPGWMEAKTSEYDKPESEVPAGSIPDTSAFLDKQPNSANEGKVEVNFGADGGDLTWGSTSENKDKE